MWERACCTRAASWWKYAHSVESRSLHPCSADRSCSSGVQPASSSSHLQGNPDHCASEFTGTPLQTISFNCLTGPL